MSVGELTALIIAITGVVALILSHRLGILGQKKDVQQQAAATKLQERIAAFDEMESINDRLTTALTNADVENTRLRALIDEAETRGDLRLAAQGRRCAHRLSEMSAALVTLQTVVLSEVARSSAQNTADLASQHIVEDHPDLD